MTEAETTIRIAIRAGLTDGGFGSSMEKRIDYICSRLFEKTGLWAISSYLEELQSKQSVEPSKNEESRK